jgi:hypothetical protein
MDWTRKVNPVNRPVMQFSFGDIAARFNHLKPKQILDDSVCVSDDLVHRVLDGTGGRAGELNEFVNGIFHR